MNMTANEIGQAGEAAARDWLQRKGMGIVAVNFRGTGGEIDIVCEDDSTLRFVEVKARNQNALVKAADAVDKRKRRRIIQTCEEYLQSHPTQKEIYHDIVEVVFSCVIQGKIVSVRHYENAFYAEDI